MKCPYCGHDNNDGNIVCNRCHAAVSAKKQEEKQPKRVAKKNDKE